MTFSVIQANVQHGEGTDGFVNYARQIAALTSGTDIVCMQERGTGDTGWDSGMTLAGFIEAIYHQHPSFGDGPSIWVKTSTVNVISTDWHDLSSGAIGWDGSANDRTAVSARLTINGLTFYLVVTHLCHSAGADSNGSTYSSIRVAQITELLSWISGTLAPGVTNVLIVGDMNFGPDYPKNPSGLQIDLFTANYIDLWQRGLSQGTATANWADLDSSGTSDMPLSSLLTRTHDTRRIDYLFLNNASAIRLVSIDVPDLRTTCSVGLTGSPQYCPDTALDQRAGVADDFGVRPSDHNWVKATFNYGASVTVRGKRGVRM